MVRRYLLSLGSARWQLTGQRVASVNKYKDDTTSDMGDFDDQLETAFSDAGYDVAELSQNRNLVRVTLTDETAQADELREIVQEIVGADAAMGLNVATETIGDGTTMGTVVSFRVR